MGKDTTIKSIMHNLLSSAIFGLISATFKMTNYSGIEMHHSVGRFDSKSSGTQQRKRRQKERRLRGGGK